MNSNVKKIANWIDSYVNKSGTKGLIFGLSGGIDSAVLAAIVSKHCKCKLAVYWIDINSSKDDRQDARLVANFLDIKLNEIDLSKLFSAHSRKIKIKNKLSLANLKVRLRMVTLYALAQENNLLVASTANAAELFVGYFTKFGDSASDLMPLAQLTKKQIYEIAKDLCIPQTIIDKKPSAGLYKDQTDEDELGVKYSEIDSYIIGKKVTSKSKKIIEKKHNENMHKFSLPVKPKS